MSWQNFQIALSLWWSWWIKITLSCYIFYIDWQWSIATFWTNVKQCHQGEFFTSASNIEVCHPDNHHRCQRKANQSVWHHFISQVLSYKPTHRNASGIQKICISRLDLFHWHLTDMIIKWEKRWKNCSPTLKKIFMNHNNDSHLNDVFRLQEILKYILLKQKSEGCNSINYGH